MTRLKEALSKRMEIPNYYSCLSILETALACSKIDQTSSIPKEMLEDALCVQNAKNGKEELDYLLEQNVLLSKKDGVLLDHAYRDEIREFLETIKKNLQMSFGQTVITAEIFLNSLTDYLKAQNIGVKTKKSDEALKKILLWEGEEYHLFVTLTYAWIPALSVKASKEKYYVVDICPFFAQKWQRLFRYFPYEPFKDYVSFFDPWYGQKMNISKGGLLSYFDWFLRDIYKKKFLIPGDFREMLHENGLLRYDDEK